MNNHHVPFSAKPFQRNGNELLVLRGELDMSTASELAGALDELIQEGPTEVILDFSELSFIDSSGVGVLVNAQERLQRQSRHLVIQSPNPAALRVLQAVGLIEHLNVRA